MALPPGAPAVIFCAHSAGCRTSQGAALHWGSRKQQSIALSTCEAEIIALSEGAEDMVSFRKLLRGLAGPAPGPSALPPGSQGARDAPYDPHHPTRTHHAPGAPLCRRHPWQPFHR